MGLYCIPEWGQVLIRLLNLEAEVLGGLGTQDLQADHVDELTQRLKALSMVDGVAPQCRKDVNSSHAAYCLPDATSCVGM